MPASHRSTSNSRTIASAPILCIQDTQTTSLFLAKCRGDLNIVEQKLSKLLAYHFDGNMRLNQEKRKLTTVGRKTKMLGMVILPNGQVTIDMEIKKKVEVLLYFFIHRRDKFLDLSDGDLDAGVKKLSGYINYINTADGPYLEKLKRKFGITVIDSFLHRTAQ